MAAATTSTSTRTSPAALSFRVTENFRQAWLARSHVKPVGNQEVFMARYVAIVDGKPGAFGVVIPDLPGCTSGGRTVDAALRNAVEAVTLWVEDAPRRRRANPKTSFSRKIARRPDVAAALANGGILAYVPLVLDAAAPSKLIFRLMRVAGGDRRGRGAPRTDPFRFPCQRRAGEDRERRIATSASLRSCPRSAPRCRGRRGSSPRGCRSAR